MSASGDTLRSDSEVPRLKPEEVKVKQGKTFLQVTQLIPAQGDNAALQLMILIDDTLNTQAVGNNLNDVKEFIKAQPPSTEVAVGYMSNATVNMLQNFTADHEQAIKAIRLPRGGRLNDGQPLSITHRRREGLATTKPAAGSLDGERRNRPASW
jgi:hypothetical protein